MRFTAVRASLDALKQLVEFRVNTKGFESILTGIKVLDGGEGNCICELPVKEELLNGVGTLHGGMTATLMDAVSTWALMTTGDSKPGVSVDLSVSYMKAAFPGSIVVIDAKTLRAGRKLAFLTIDLKDKKTGQLLAQGKHTKYLG
ncbi:hypothetical protein LOTGIDRAFT_157816 [Lottia gigantea]|uniref:Acyl-coenzyme A thioesterase 13 n=1 Tax=Lottia gigantea TaxID=225164 RepID=V4B2F8_LOTGI|nr:hypothetical protein LOTGIDRAFT_157816 [Lottia gigantea]ESP00542.1 hypothetical protein LOTGIDRAFT_157816 [Lottia gigantea]